MGKEGGGGQVIWMSGGAGCGPKEGPSRRDRALPEASGLKVHASSCRFDGSSIDKQSLEEKG